MIWITSYVTFDDVLELYARIIMDRRSKRNLVISTCRWILKDTLKRQYS